MLPCAACINTSVITSSARAWGFAGVCAAAPAGANDLCVGASASCVLSGVLGGGAGVLCTPTSPIVRRCQVPHELSTSPCASRLSTSPLVQVDYASSPVASARRTVVDISAYGRLFSVSRARRVEYGVVRSADGRLRTMHSRLRAGAARLCASTSRLSTKSSELIVATGAVCALTGTLCIVFDAVGARCHAHLIVASSRLGGRATHLSALPRPLRPKQRRLPCISPIRHGPRIAHSSISRRLDVTRA